MKNLSMTSRSFTVSGFQQKKYSVKGIESMLKAFSRIDNKHFFMVDYFTRQIIVDSLLSPILCGYSKEVLKKEGLAFWGRVVKSNEHNWVYQRDLALFHMYNDYPVSKRKSLEVSFDVTVVTKDKQEFILRTKIIPYELCESGNLWLALGSASMSPGEKTNINSCYISDIETGEKFNFIDNKFVLSPVQNLFQEELEILTWMSDGFSAKQISSKLKISEAHLKRKKKVLYDKLDAGNSVQAVRKAHLMGLINLSNVNLK